MNKQEARQIKENPFSKIIEEMRKQGEKANPPSVQIGQIISSQPLVIRIGDLQVDEDNILIADYLLKDYKKTASIKGVSLTGSTSTSKNHKHNLTSLDINQSVINFSSNLNNGDNLAVLATSDKQTYIILAKLVKP